MFDGRSAGCRVGVLERRLGERGTTIGTALNRCQSIASDYPEIFAVHVRRRKTAGETRNRISFVRTSGSVLFCRTRVLSSQACTRIAASTKEHHLCVYSLAATGADSSKFFSNERPGNCQKFIVAIGLIGMGAIRVDPKDSSRRFTVPAPPAVPANPGWLIFSMNTPQNSPRRSTYCSGRRAPWRRAVRAPVLMATAYSSAGIWEARTPPATAPWRA